MTNIEWTDKTWNPIVGCSAISPGCANCYAVKMANRLNAIADSTASERLKTYQGLTKNNNWTGQVRFVPEAIHEVFKRRKPTKWFVNSMSDLFHEKVEFEWIDQIMAAIALTPYHTYQVLTKRPERMQSYFEYFDGSYNTDCNLLRFVNNYRYDYPKKFKNIGVPNIATSPLQNLWLGVSTENQKTFNDRVSILLDTSAKIRFLSVEPMLERIDISSLEKGQIDWVIIGGESGAKARPFEFEWGCALVDQCKKMGIKVFFKQAGNNPYYCGQRFKLTGKGNHFNELPSFLQIREMPFD